MTWLWLMLAWGAQSVDLNGDGQKETIASNEDAVTIGESKIDCSDMGDPCGIEVVDVLSSDKLKELKVCSHGPREGPYCTLYRFDGAKAVPITISGGTDYLGDLTISGSGIVLLSNHNRLFTQIKKYVVEGLTLKEVPQPAYYANLKVKVETTFPIRVSTSETASTVGNVRPNSEIVLVALMAGEGDWYLVKLSSGITGYVKLETLIEHSMDVRGPMFAG